MILLIDDESRWISGYLDALKLSGYNCELICNVDELDAWLDNDENFNLVDLIILDIMMAPRNRYSEMNTEDGIKTGEFVFDEIINKNPQLPVIILTNKDSESNGRTAFKKCRHYLLKEETEPKSLVTIVNAMLRNEL
jgi:DNA-binding NarL/FixJ family response regulator